jgi:hypothetical protein
MANYNISTEVAIASRAWTACTEGSRGTHGVQRSNRGCPLEAGPRCNLLQVRGRWHLVYFCSLSVCKINGLFTYSSLHSIRCVMKHTHCCHTRICTLDAAGLLEHRICCLRLARSSLLPMKQRHTAQAVHPCGMKKSVKRWATTRGLYSPWCTDETRGRAHASSSQGLRTQPRLVHTRTSRPSLLGPRRPKLCHTRSHHPGVGK